MQSSSDKSAEEEDLKHLFFACPYSKDRHGEQCAQCSKCYSRTEEHYGARDTQFVSNIAAPNK